jgi:two-component system, OmpR family, sensor histidine kinase TctE
VLYRADHKALAVLDLAAMVQAMVARFTPMAEMKDMVLRLAPLPAGLQVQGDAVLVEAALRNIIDNAIKYSPLDSEIDLSAEAVAGMAVVRVCDRGRGLGAGPAQALHVRFQRGTNVADVAGSGLGLTIIDESAVAMGGGFSLTEREGGGTCATLSLPLLA